MGLVSLNKVEPTQGSAPRRAPWAPWAPTGTDWHRPTDRPTTQKPCQNHPKSGPRGAPGGPGGAPGGPGGAPGAPIGLYRAISWVVYKQFPEKNKISKNRQNDELQAIIPPPRYQN